VKHDRRPTVITDAPESPADELRRRQRRYIVMMAVRALCLVLAAVLTMVGAPLLPLWVGLCLVGAVVLPWLAVILANDRAPKPEHRLGARRAPAPAAEPVQRSLPAAREPTVIDAEP